MGSILFYVPLNNEQVLLKACDLEADCKIVSMLFWSGKDQKRNGNNARTPPSLANQDRCHMIFQHGGTLLLVDCLKRARPVASQTLYFAKMKRAGMSGYSSLELLRHMTYKVEANSLYFEFDQHEENVVLGFFGRFDKEVGVIIIRNLQTASTTKFELNMNRSISKHVSLACSTLQSIPKKGGKFCQMLLFDGNVRKFEPDGASTLGERPYSIAEHYFFGLSDIKVDHSCGVAVCSAHASSLYNGCNRLSMVAGVDVASLEVLWRISYPWYDGCSCLQTQTLWRTHFPQTVLARSGLVLVGFPCKILTLRSRDGEGRGLLSLAEHERVLSNLTDPWVARDYALQPSYWYRAVGLWNLAVLPPASLPHHAEGGGSWRLLVVYDLRRFAPLAFEVLNLT